MLRIFLSILIAQCTIFLLDYNNARRHGNGSAKAKQGEASFGVWRMCCGCMGASSSSTHPNSSPSSSDSDPSTSSKTDAQLFTPVSSLEAVPTPMVPDGSSIQKPVSILRAIGVEHPAAIKMAEPAPIVGTNDEVVAENWTRVEGNSRREEGNVGKLQSGGSSNETKSLRKYLKRALSISSSSPKQIIELIFKRPKHLVEKTRQLVLEKTKLLHRGSNGSGSGKGKSSKSSPSPSPSPSSSSNKGLKSGHRLNSARGATPAMTASNSSSPKSIGSRSFPASLNTHDSLNAAQSPPMFYMSQDYNNPVQVLHRPPSSSSINNSPLSRGYQRKVVASSDGNKGDQPQSHHQLEQPISALLSQLHLTIPVQAARETILPEGKNVAASSSSFGPPVEEVSVDVKGHAAASGGISGGATQSGAAVSSPYYETTVGPADHNMDIAESTGGHQLGYQRDIAGPSGTKIMPPVGIDPRMEISPLSPIFQRKTQSTASSPTTQCNTKTGQYPEYICKNAPDSWFIVFSHLRLLTTCFTKNIDIHIDNDLRNIWHGFTSMAITDMNNIEIQAELYCEMLLKNRPEYESLKRLSVNLQIFLFHCQSKQNNPFITRK